MEGLGNLMMTTRPGYTGKLNAQILERIRVMSEVLDLPRLAEKFPHLSTTDGSWRKTGEDLSRLGDFIDHTQLKADATEGEILQLCAEAKHHHFKAVCVNGCRVKLAVERLHGTGVGVACVVGFPLGQMTTTSKAAEAAEAVANGACDIDMVINVGQLRDKNYRYVYEDVKAVCVACGPQTTTKVIFETCLLTEVEIIDCAILCVAAGATYVKTSTGFSTKGSTPEVVDVMVAVVGNAALVKAAGGVRDKSTAEQYVAAGVRRIGTSSGIAIVQGDAAPTSHY